MSIKAKFFLVALIIFGLGIARFEVWQKSQPIYKDGSQAHLSGYLDEEPKRKGRLNHFSFQNLKVISDQEAHYGDYLTISGKIKNNSLFLPEIKVEERGFFFTKFLTSIRRSSIEKINQILPEPEAGLANGILLGNKSDLNSDLVANLKTTGTIHVVVVSGYNITVVGGLFLLLSSLIKRRNAIILALIAITFYSFMTGLSAPTFRALVMAAIAYAGVYFGRVVYPIYALGLVALIAYFLNPSIVFDIGFQLSFLATAGIIVFSKKLEGVFEALPKLLRGDLATTLSAQSLVVPVIFFYFGSVSLISPLANIATLWVIPFVTIVGFVVLGFSFIYLPLAQLLSLLILIPLKYFTILTAFFAQIPLASISIEKENAFFVVGYLFFLASLVVFYWRKNEIKSA